MDVRVDGKEPLSECNRRVFENRVRLIVEGAVTILTETPLKYPIAAVPNHGFGTQRGQ